MRIGLSLLLALVATAAVAANPPKDVDALTVRAKLRGDWRELDVRVPRDQQLRASFGIQWTMYKPADRTSPPNQARFTDHDNESTQTDGVLVLNTDANPMWLDFRFKDGTGEYVWVGIFRFEGDQPRWVLNKEWVKLDTWEAAKGKVPKRPTRFEDDKKQPVGYRLEPFTFGRNKCEPSSDGQSNRWSRSSSLLISDTR
ncbi:unnamed protein product [Gemmata massiliana]|uniref:Uncharacterized protein n=1 Tax=Gemmata massiliana TaxID=1210884 RepID=A0A6P2DAQ7_9BACT|nr:hypothetical protein [Gemmata massiliana]VTR97656.1 unnamed protein product [Gemmata massiliana]